MKSTFFISLIITFLLGLNVAHAQRVVPIKKIPKSVEEFLELRDDIAQTPEGGASMFILAMMVYTENEKLGLEMLTIALDRKSLREGDCYKGFCPLNGDRDLLERQIGNNGGKKFIPFSYIAEGSPETDYAVPEEGFTFSFTGKVTESEMNAGEVRLYVKCSGADSPRPMSIRRNDKGLWKICNFSSVVVGVRIPKSMRVKDDL